MSELVAGLTRTVSDHRDRPMFLPLRERPFRRLLDGTSLSMERWALLACFVVISLATAMSQRPARLIADGTEYHAMAAQYAAGQSTVSARAPFVFRIATPWLASRLDPLVEGILPPWLSFAIEDANGLKGFAGFYAVNIAASLAALLLLHRYVSLFVTSGRVRLLVTALWIIQWHTPVRFSYFYPAYVDPLFLVFLFAGLLVVERSPLLLRTSLTVSLISLAGTFSRETILLIPVMFFLRHWQTLMNRPAPREMLLLLAPLAVALCGLAGLRALGTPTSPYSALDSAIGMMGEKPLYAWVLAWFFTFGPAALALIAAATGDTWKLLRARPWLGWYLSFCAVLAYVGGTDTERLLAWAAPVMMVLLARSLERYASTFRTSPTLVALLLAIALVSARAFWVIPSGVESPTQARELGLNWHSLVAVLDKLLVMRNYYSNLWSFFGSTTIHLFQLVFDVALTAGLVVLIRRRADAVHASLALTKDAARC